MSSNVNMVENDYYDHMQPNHHHHRRQHHQQQHPQHPQQQQHPHLTRVVKCTLDDDQCLSLQDILLSFQTAINEEQAWALCYETVKCFRQFYQQPQPSNHMVNSSHVQCALFEPERLAIHKDGYVHPKTITGIIGNNNLHHDKRSSLSIDGNDRRPPTAATTTTTTTTATLDTSATTEVSNCHKMLTSLGIVLFRALDYGLCDDEERTLSKPLELLIERLTTAHEFSGKNRTNRHRIGRHHQHHRTSTNHHHHHHHYQEMMHSLGSFYDDDHPEDYEDDDDNVPGSVNDDEQEDDDDDECANADDEGIERDCHEYQSSLSSNIADCNSQLEQVIQMCVSRLSSRESADTHYKAVCRALIAETLELSTFLNQIANGTKELRKSSSTTIVTNNGTNDSESTLERLQFHDWARLWIQVIRELRHGVKLKKVDHDESFHNTEYELTPYEMLLDDIRSRRYKLNKVMINGDLPLRVKKDAHELILDFIRSRPPLVPVSKRVLKPPPPRQVTVYERLMESLRQEHKLRPTPRPRTSYHSFSAHTTPIHRPVSLADDCLPKTTTTKTDSATSIERPTPIKSASQVTSRRKVKVKVNFDFNLNDDDDDDDDDDFNDEQLKRIESAVKGRPMSAYIPSEIDLNIDQIDDRSNLGQVQCKDDNGNKVTNDDGDSKLQSNAKMLRLKRFSNRLFSRERRHSICGMDTKSVQPHQSQPSDMIADLDFEEDARNHVATIWESTELGKSLECLSLTLKEVQHIRSVLTKAEIESLGVTKSLKNDLENGKICFTCLKTRFTFWGPWATICKLCNRAICDRCATKMHIPTEQFERVPIYMLSPTPSPPNEKNPTEIFNWNKSDHSGAQNTSESENEGESKSLPPKINFSRTRMSRIVRMLTLHHETHGNNDSNESLDNSTSNQQTQQQSHGSGNSGGPLVKVCRDCKILVRHLVDIGHTNFGSHSTIESMDKMKKKTTKTTN